MSASSPVEMMTGTWFGLNFPHFGWHESAFSFFGVHSAVDHLKKETKQALWFVLTDAS